MTRHPRSNTVLVAAVLFAAVNPTAGAAAGTPNLNAQARLRANVIGALRADNTVVVGVLWTDRVPRFASASMRGPALAALKASAATRARQGLRVRMIHERYRILTITIRPGGMSASAVVQSDQVLSPTFLNGDPRGAPLHLDERGQFTLHRLPRTRRFVVWSVTLQ